MKKIISIMVLACAISCHDDSEIPYQSAGTITGLDYRYCACCGGYFIKIEDSNYRFFELPDHAGFDLDNETFPVHVVLNWEKENQSCLDDLITVKAIRKL